MAIQSFVSAQSKRGLWGLSLCALLLGAPAMAATSAPAAGQQMLPHAVDRSLTLVADGQSQAVIVYPSIPEGRALGEQVQAAVAAATGVKPAVAADTAVVQTVPQWPAEDYRKVPLILIGNIGVNRAIVPLYANLLAGADAYYPGGDGYTLRTVVNPYGAGVNELVLGASSAKGMDRAVKAFAALMQKQGKQGKLALAGVLEVHPEGEVAKEVERAIQAKPTDRTYATPLNYQWTASPAVLKNVLANLRAERFMKPQAKNLGTADYGTEMTARELISLIDAGVLSDQEVQHLETVMLGELHREEGVFPWNTIRPGWVGTRHQAMGMMGTMVMGDYLLHHARPTPEAAEYLKKRLAQATEYFKQFETLYRDEGNDNTSMDSNGPILRYFMAFGDARIFTSGTAEKMAQRAVMMADNDGHFVGPGNYEDSRPGAMSDTLLRFPHYAIGVTAFVNRDPGLHWILQKGYAKPLDGKNWAINSGIAGERYPVPAEVAAARPEQWLGACALHLSPYHYLLSGDYMTHGAVKKDKQPWEALVPLAKALDMLSFRDGYAPGDPYLFILGAQGGRYDSMGANSIVRYADRGHLWLIAQTEQFGHYFHNALHIGRRYDGKYLSMPGAIREDVLANFPEGSMTATTLPGFNGADWTRQVFWQHGQYVVVIDTATFNEAGDYDLTCTWRSLPIATLDADGVWRATTADATFELHNADGLEQHSGHERAENTEQIAVYPYTLRQHEALSAQKGQHVSIKNLFYTRPRNGGPRFDLRPAGPDAVMVSDGSSFALIGVNPASQRMEMGPFATDARMFVISTEALRLAGAGAGGAGGAGAHLWLEGKEVAANQPSAEVSAALKAMWATLQPTQPAKAAPAPAPKTSPAPAAQPLWTYDGFQTLAQEIGGVRVSPQPTKDADLLFDRQALNYVPRINWPSGTKAVTYDLGQVEDIGRIQLERLLDYKYLSMQSTERQPFWVKDKAGSMPLSFSDDNFKSDVRNVDMPYDEVYRQDVPYHYKWTYMPSYWKQFPARSAGPLNIKARYVRTPPGQTFETTFFRAAQRPADIDRLCAVDVDGDGKQELAIATEARQVSLLNGDGSVRWSKMLDNRITDLLALDLNGDGKQALLISDNGWYIRGYDAEGKQVYSADSKKAGIGGAFALGSIVPRGADSKKPFPVVAATRGATVFDPRGQRYCAVLYGLSVSDVVLAGKTTNPLAIYRTGTRNPWQIAGWKDMAWFPPDQRQRPVETKLAGGSMTGPWWLSFGMEYWPEDDAPDASWHNGLAVVIARVGVYAYDLGSKTPSSKPIWRVMDNGPISGYAWAEMDGKPGLELVVCRQDGFVDVLDRSGQVIRSWPVGAPAYSVCRWNKDGAALAVATGDAVIFYDAQGKPISRVNVAARKLLVLKDGPQQTLIVAAPGHTAAFR